MFLIAHPDGCCELIQAAYEFYSTTRWKDPVDVGNYFIVPTTAITNTDQKSEERKWQAGKDLMDTYRNMCTSLRQIFERSIDPAYHSGVMTNTGMASRGFGSDKPPAIFERLNILYGTPILKELDQPYSASRTQWIAPTGRVDAPHH